MKRKNRLPLGLAVLFLLLSACAPAAPRKPAPEKTPARAEYVMAEPTETLCLYRLNTALLPPLGDVISAVSRERYLLIRGVRGEKYYLILADMAEGRLLGLLEQTDSFGEPFLLADGSVLLPDGPAGVGRLLDKNLAVIGSPDRAEAEALRARREPEEVLTAGFGLWRLRESGGKTEYTVRKKSFSEALLRQENGCLLTEEKQLEGGTVYRLRDYRNGSLAAVNTAGISAEGTLYPLYRDGEADSLLFREDKPGDDGLLLWDIGRETAVPDRDCGKRSVEDELTPEMRLKKAREELEEAFGIGLLLTEKELEEFSESYSGSPCSEEELPDYLAYLTRLLEAWPEGFFRELPGNAGGVFRLGICRELRKDGAKSSDAAVTVTRGGQINVILCSSRAVEWERTLVHELCHAMERRFAEYAAENGAAAEKYWNETLNTEEYPYFFSYTEGAGTAAGTLSGDKTAAWFLDSYSRSFPREDRARILEALWAGDGEALSSVPLRDKARFLSALIRAAFPSVRRAKEPAPFERLFGPQELPAAVFTSGEP